MNLVIYSQWEQVSSGMGNISINSFALLGNKIFVGSYGNGVLFTTNSGLNWTYTSLGALQVNSVIENNNILYAGTEFNGIYKSTNDGYNWIQVLNRPTIRALASDGLYIYAGTSDSGIYKSSNSGISWSLSSLNNRSIHSIFINGNYIYAGCDVSGIYFSTNSGVNWTQTSLNNTDVRTICANGSYIFAGTYGEGIFISSNNGSSWSQSQLGSEFILTLVSRENNIFAGSTTFGVYASNNNGNTWIMRNEGLPYAIVAKLFIANNFLFAGRYNGGVYRRELNQLIGINPISSEIPESFSLFQNYPNPFNPSTKIKFAIPFIPSAAQTFLSVFDIFGRQVTALISQQLTPGTYEVEWDASNQPSGLYLYKLTTGDFSETKKMILVK
ncbi:MAG: T9SS type A sorting domain-containing protein [Ignavibacteria bacterium]|nr:T9SS type A sorting domain-containing protein [Ignavibacteria bacterium]